MKKKEARTLDIFLEMEDNYPKEALKRKPGRPRKEKDKNSYIGNKTIEEMFNVKDKTMNNMDLC